MSSLGDASSGGRLVAACVVNELIPDHWGDLDFTAIDKRPQPGAIVVDTLGLVGDQQVDTRFHGGTDQAVYAYATEDLSVWARELDRDLSYGCFGENLSTEGIDVTGALIGERWAIGTVVLSVTAPRVPCRTFQGFLDEPQWVKRFTVKGWPGAYLSVAVPGEIQAGDRIEVVHRPDHDVTIADLFAVLSGDRERLARVAACPDLTAKSREKIAAIVAAVDAGSALD